MTPAYHPGTQQEPPTYAPSLAAAKALGVLAKLTDGEITV